MTTWPIKKLGEVCERYFSGVWGENPDNNGNVFVVRVSDVKDDGVLDYCNLPLRYVAEKKIHKYQLQDGDLIVVKSSGSKKKIISGKTAIFVEQKGKRILASNFVLVLRPNQRLVLPKWLLFYLNGDEAKEFIKKIIGITTYPNLKPQEYLKMEIPLPPLKIQKRIVARIEELFEKIDKAKELREKALEETEQIFQSALQKVFDKTGKKYNLKLLKEVLTQIQYGISKKMNEIGEGYKILRMDNIVNGRIDVKNIKYVKIEKNEFLKYKLEKGDILFNRVNSFELVGKTGIFDLEGDYTFASYLIRLRVNPNFLTPYFLNYFFNSPQTQDKLRFIARRAVQQANINAKEVSSLSIPLFRLFPSKKRLWIILMICEKK